jgi:prepilin-type N-terminal cleavage/methylation domain-containing protein
MGGGTAGKGASLKVAKKERETARAKVTSELFCILAIRNMKSHPSSRRRRLAFTLVELLVVIGIIAILASVLVASVGSAIRFAKRTKANTTASQISTAVQNYYTEYGIYPTADAAGAATDDYYTGQAGGEGMWHDLMYALCGNVNAAQPPQAGQTNPQLSVPNTRGIAYLQPAHSDIDQNGIFVNPFGTVAGGVANGPAANTAPYFYMVVDTDYSGVAGDSSGTKIPDFTKTPTNYQGQTLANGTPGGVAVWSPCDQPIAGGTATSASPSAFWAHTY